MEEFRRFSVWGLDLRFRTLTVFKLSVAVRLRDRGIRVQESGANMRDYDVYCCELHRVVMR